MTCRHNQLRAQVSVSRLSDKEGGPITGYTADVTIVCAECNIPFRFIGVPAGYDFATPRVSIDGTELRAPIEPAEHERFAPHASYRIPPRARQ